MNPLLNDKCLFIGDISKLSEETMVVKEGVEFKIQVEFRVSCYGKVLDRFNSVILSKTKTKRETV